MKTFLVATAAALFICFASVNGADTKTEGDLTTTTFSVAGMHCQPCADSITAALTKEKGVDKAEVKFSEKKAIVSYHTSEVTPDQIIATVKAAGYDAKKE